MSTEKLITVLEEIRDQQKQQIDNYEQTMSLQEESMQLQRRVRRIFLFLIIAPWVLVFMLLLILLLRPVAFDFLL